MQAWVHQWKEHSEKDEKEYMRKKYQENELGGRLLVQRTLAESKSAGGIILGEPLKTNTGTVIAVGPGDRLMDGTIAAVRIPEGATVFLPEYGGVKIPGTDPSDKDEFFVYREDEILAVVEE